MSSKTASTNKHSPGKNCAAVETRGLHKRTKVSMASSDLMFYCEEHARSDSLLTGIPTSENLLKDKKTCIIL
uniref:Guanine nucleotide-binding protein subunit gamma n=2 Tax=Ursus TaxID=9639 RepID=A0A452T692_URSMA